MKEQYGLTKRDSERHRDGNKKESEGRKTQDSGGIAFQARTK